MLDSPNLKWFLGGVGVFMGLCIMLMFMPILMDVHSYMTADNADQMSAWLEDQGYVVLADASTPLAEDLYSRNIYPGVDSTYDIGRAGGEYAEGHFDKLYAGGTEVVRSVNVVVAASDASAIEIAQSDFQCDGVADNEEIQAAITIGGKVALAGRTFTLAAQLVPTSGLELIGIGKPRPKVVCTGVVNPFLMNASLVNVTIENIEWENTGADYLNWWVSSIAFPGTNLTVNNCEWDNVRLNAQGAVTNVRITNNYFHDIVTTGTPRGAIHVGAIAVPAASEGYTVTGNIIEDIQGTGMVLQGGLGVLVKGNDIRDASGIVSSRFVIDVSDCTQVNIADNIIRSPFGIVSEDSVGIVSITGNTIVGGNTSLGIGIRLWRNADSDPLMRVVSIDGNNITNIQNGIDIDDIGDAVISDNDIGTIGQTAISVRKSAGWGVDPSQVIISDSLLYNFGNVTNWMSGIAYNCDNLHITDNTIDGAGNANTRGIKGNSVSVPGTLIADNTLTNITDNALNNIVNATVRHNLGYVTENWGTGIGTGAEQTIAHGLDTTPTYLDCFGNSTACYRSSASTGTDIYLTANLGDSYAWEAKVR